jgi:GxxExxY protein
MTLTKKQAEKLLSTKHTKDTKMNDELLFKDECYAIQGAVFEVYREMGCGFLEGVYQECLEKEFGERKIPFVAQRELILRYKGEVLRQTYRPDMLCYEKIIVELKALREITGEHRSQVLNYLKSTGFRLGLLVNFGNNHKAVVERIVL